MTPDGRKYGGMSVRQIITGAIVLGLAAVLVTMLLRSKGSRSLDAMDAQVRALGFTPVLPASRHVPPGTYVQVLTSDPLTLSVVCSAEECLGAEIAGAVIDTPSFSSEQLSQLSGRFHIEGTSLPIAVEGGASFVREIQISLSNVRIREVTDAAVLKHCAHRSDACTSSITLRRQAEHDVTLIKAVLQADASFRVTFSEAAEEKVKQSVLEELSASLDAHVDSSGSERVVGNGLIWGVRDDRLLALLPDVELPATGSPNDRASLPENARARVTVPKDFVSLPVPGIRQPKRMACWAATGAMMSAWREAKQPDVHGLLSHLGQQWITRYDDDSGLPPEDQERFAGALGLVVEPPQNFTTQAYKSMLRDRGPLWITTGDLFNSHARLLVGFVEGETLESTFLEFIDPSDGKRRYQAADDFHRQFEEEARQITGFDVAVDLRPQVLHW